MRIEIDRSLCEGHAQCVLAGPHLFALDGEDRSTLVEGADPDAYPQEAKDADLLCPEHAITLVD